MTNNGRSLKSTPAGDLLLSLNNTMSSQQSTVDRSTTLTLHHPLSTPSIAMATCIYPQLITQIYKTVTGEIVCYIICKMLQICVGKNGDHDMDGSMVISLACDHNMAVGLNAYPPKKAMKRMLYNHFKMLS